MITTVDHDDDAAMEGNFESSPALDPPITDAMDSRLASPSARSPLTAKSYPEKSEFSSTEEVEEVGNFPGEDTEQPDGFSQNKSRTVETVHRVDDILLSAFRRVLDEGQLQDTWGKAQLVFIGEIIMGIGAANKSADTVPYNLESHKIHITKRKVSDIVRYVIDHIDRPINLLDLCKVTGLSASHLCRAMKMDTGLTPYNFVIRVRIEFARQILLSTNQSLVEVALACGFSSQPHFCATFKKLTGQTPGQFRRLAATLRDNHRVVASGTSPLVTMAAGVSQPNYSAAEPKDAGDEVRPRPQRRLSTAIKARTATAGDGTR